MSEMPGLIPDPELRAPECGYHQRDYAENRQKSETGAPRHVEKIGHLAQFWTDGQKDQRVHYDQADCDQRNLAVKVIHDVLAPRLSDKPEACRKAELQAHHRQAAVTDRNRKLRPEVARRRMRAQQKREQGGENEDQIYDDPNRTPEGIERHQASSHPSRRRWFLPQVDCWVGSLCYYVWHGKSSLVGRG